MLYVAYCKIQRYLALILPALVVFYSGPTNAADYIWRVSAQGYNFDGASASASCNAYMTFRDSYSPKYKHTVTGMELITTASYRCHYEVRGLPGTNVAGLVTNDAFITSRLGDSCPPDHTLNTTDPSQPTCIPLAPEPGGEKCGEEVVGGATIPKIKNAEGECVPFYDADKPSQCKHFSESTRFTTAIISVDDNGNPSPPPPIVEHGCVATVIDYSHCKAPAPKKVGAISLGPAPVRCRVALNFTGDVADGEPPVFAPPPVDPGDVCPEGEECTPPDAPIVSEKEPCVYVPDGEGRMVCSSSNYTSKPGDYTNCGSVNNGPFKCYGTNPSSTGTMTDTKVETKQNADGSTTTTKTDTQTKVVCSGVGSCSSQVTTNVSHTTKDANGNTTSESSKCTGPNCSSSGGIKDGSGTGNGDGNGEGDESEGPAGPSKGLSQGEQGSFDEALTEWDQRIADARAELDQQLSEYGALFSGVFELNLSEGGGSLPCDSINLSHGATYRLCIADFSDPLSWLRYALLLGAAVIAAYIVLRN
ncbi:hypothetical protein [Ectopseudomonas khazarica]|uniref:hypothetical protein n=1 Tax=Ectopseudomonas khazarica TaxID=2502979 RepID=UPI003B9574D1